MSQSRKASVSRKTKETDITIEINLDGSGKSAIDTGIGFFDHMLDAFSRHSGYDLTVKAVGDLHVDAHHLVEDSGIVLGQAVADALGDKRGIARFGEARIPMDEALAEVAIDISGRSFLVMEADFFSPVVGTYSTQMTKHFFESFASAAGINMNMKVEGDNDHHKTEALFKAFAYAMKRATVIEGQEIKSTKGVL
ncbi:Histidine biosynthesis bifunctional protein HisB [Methanimicrococcus stummii]|uniref:Imidazoleglycerol-phosphate dehydratase n=1 Tax=Methanimicrococcus stummii TaxID=3028294 RepID=A0AA96VKH6_9EURY|nr:imidazoleglycerol-phosphate dehydratase HisB [Methanimicrococcus sp. Es2]WNY28022.1 Histidine biosynthesis bifunctional protein HisB [Methanimicrococcus sp. Es2]